MSVFPAGALSSVANVAILRRSGSAIEANNGTARRLSGSISSLSLAQRSAVRTTHASGGLRGDGRQRTAHARAHDLFGLDGEQGGDARRRLPDADADPR